MCCHSSTECSNACKSLRWSMRPTTLNVSSRAHPQTLKKTCTASGSKFTIAATARPPRRPPRLPARTRAVRAQPRARTAQRRARRTPRTRRPALPRPARPRVRARQHSGRRTVRCVCRRRGRAGRRTRRPGRAGRWRDHGRRDCGRQLQATVPACQREDCCREEEGVSPSATRACSRPDGGEGPCHTHK